LQPVTYTDFAHSVWDRVIAECAGVELAVVLRFGSMTALPHIEFCVRSEPEVDVVFYPAHDNPVEAAIAEYNRRVALSVEVPCF
jgi:hypothetical protein